MRWRNSTTDLRDNLHVRLFEGGYLHIGDGWNTQNVRSTFWRLYRNEQNGATLQLDSGVYSLIAERLHFVPAGVHFGCQNTQDIQHFYVHFDVIGVPAIAMRELFAAPISLPCCAGLESDVQHLGAALAHGGLDPLVLHCRLKSVLYAALALCIESVPTEQLTHCWQYAEALEPVLPAIHHIENHLATRLLNSDLCVLCHMSENFFIRRFRECVGMTPAQYILERRIALATQHLLFTRESIERIAEITGFGNRYYFSRVFARHMGLPPVAYRSATHV